MIYKRTDYYSFMKDNNYNINYNINKNELNVSLSLNDFVADRSNCFRYYLHRMQPKFK